MTSFAHRTRPVLDPQIPTIDDLRAAETRLAGAAIRTPLLESPVLNEALGGRLLIKAESLQRTGSFKFRGAFNRVAMLTADQRRRGVVAFSSGNHAQGVAAATALLKVPTVIVMPQDAPSMKIRNTRAFGAELVFYDRTRDSREDISERIASERGMILIPPYDDFDVIAGQATVGLELAEQVAERGLHLDAVFANCSGGGLASGCAIALKHFDETIEIYAVEPENFDDTRRSLEAGRRLSNVMTTGSICDSLMASMPGHLTFPIMQRWLAGGLVASDAEVREAIVAAFVFFKLVVEPGGAAALGAVLAGRYDLKGRTVAVICSGGNIDPHQFAAILSETPLPPTLDLAARGA